MSTTLHPKFWKDSKLSPKVRKNLLQIAQDFLSFVKIKKLKIVDIVFTGSLANYNYNERSDVDVHIVLDLSRFEKNEDFIEEYLQSRKLLWNQDHDVLIYGFPVEVYPENKNKIDITTGVFSLLKNKWIHQPKDVKIEYDETKLNEKYVNIVTYIDKIERLSLSSNFYNYKHIIKKIDYLKDKLRDNRYQGLKKEGHGSIHNILYKKLRTEGILKKLSDIKKRVYDKSLSVENLETMSESMMLSNKNIFVANRNIGVLHLKKDDTMKVMNITENSIRYRNLNNRKTYNVTPEDFNACIDNKFIQKIK